MTLTAASALATVVDMTPQIQMIPVAELSVGRHVAGAEVTAVRTSGSGRTVFITVRRPDGSGYDFRQDASTRIAVHATECRDCGVQLNIDGTVDALPDEPAEHYAGCAVCQSHPAFNADNCPQCATSTRIASC